MHGVCSVENTTVMVIAKNTILFLKNFYHSWKEINYWLLIKKVFASNLFLWDSSKAINYWLLLIILLIYLYNVIALYKYGRTL